MSDDQTRPRGAMYTFSDKYPNPGIGRCILLGAVQILLRLGCAVHGSGFAPPVEGGTAIDCTLVV